LELEFAAPIADVRDLAKRLCAIKTTLDAPDLPEQPEEEDVADHLERCTRICFVWE